MALGFLSFGGLLPLGQSELCGVVPVHPGVTLAHVSPRVSVVPFLACSDPATEPTTIQSHTAQFAEKKTFVLGSSRYGAAQLLMAAQDVFLQVWRNAVGYANLRGPLKALLVTLSQDAALDLLHFDGPSEPCPRGKDSQLGMVAGSEAAQDVHREA